MYLNVHTYYSFRYGTLSVRELLSEAQAAGVRVLALTDINSTSASLDFVRLAPQYGIRPVLGVDFRNGVQPLFVALAQNNDGYREINAYLSHFLCHKKAIPPMAPNFKSAYVIYPYRLYRGQALRAHEYIGVKPWELSRMTHVGPRWSAEKLVAMPTLTFRSSRKEIHLKREVLKRDINTHRLLRAIDKNTLLSKLPISEEADTNDFVYPVAELHEIYQDHKGLLERSRQLLTQCHIHFDFEGKHLNKNLKNYTASEEEDDQMLRALCKKGLAYRYPHPSKKVLQRIDMELEIIRQQGFMSYFLINWDICAYARSKGYFYVGRGSGANSVVAYLLRITDVDPVELDLYFERFINIYRKSPPDFDIDFSWSDREDMTQYIFKRFDHVALLAAFNTFQLRSVIRELGKVLGLPPHEIEYIQKSNGASLDHTQQLVLRYGHYIQGFPSHLSIHAGGILIAEKPIHCYSATDLPPKGFPTVHFDMLTAEDIGLYKFDILSQRGLSKIKEALAWIRENQPDAPPIDIHNMTAFKKDERIKSLLRAGKTIGCFYVESPAMRMLLTKLKVEEYLGLVAASSVIRPGVAQSGMMREYILRFRYPEKRKEAHPILQEIMPDTFGVMVYQEDVIKVAHYFAGLTLAESDVLRRGMSGKYRSRAEFDKVKQKFFENCRQMGHAQKLSEEVWRQIESFAGYAFAKGHSASYAVESYQSLFLKAYFPLEYMVATLNNGGGFYQVELYVHEAKMHGADVQPPCVNESVSGCRIQGKTIYMGLSFIQGMANETVASIVAEREENGVFMSFNHFLSRVPIALEQLTLLIRINAFRFTGKPRKALLWEAHLHVGNKGRSRPTRSLFPPDAKSLQLPELSTDALEDAFEQIELLGFALCPPFHLLKELPEGIILTRQMCQFTNQKVRMVGYLVHVKTTKTVQRKPMQFGTWLDEEGHFLDTTHFPPIAAKYPFRGKGFYLLIGKVVNEFDFLSLEVTAMQKLDFVPDPRFIEDARMVNKRTRVVNA